MKKPELPLLHMIQIEAGKQLKVYAVHFHCNQHLPACHCDGDAYFSVQQGVFRLNFSEGFRMLQPRDSEFLTAGKPFRIEALTDARAQLILPAQAELVFE